MRKPEAKLQTKIVAVLRSKGALVTTTSDIGRGVADLIVLFEGRYIELELKTESGDQRRLQEIRQELIHMKGGEYYVVRHVEDIDFILDKRNSTIH